MGKHLTIHSSRRRFAARLNSSVRPHMKILRLVKIHVLLLSVTMLAACASGSALVTGTARTPVAPEQVQLYLEPPTEFEVIGIVNASLYPGQEVSPVDFWLLPAFAFLIFWWYHADSHNGVTSGLLGSM